MTEYDSKVEEDFDYSPHDHDWDPIAVNEARIVLPFAQPTTNVLLRCGICRLPKALTLVGNWTIEQIKGE